MVVITPTEVLSAGGEDPAGESGGLGVKVAVDEATTVDP